MRKIVRLLCRIMVRHPNILWDVCLASLIRFCGFQKPISNFKSLHKTVKKLDPFCLSISTSFTVIFVESAFFCYKIPLTTESENKLITEYQNWLKLTKDDVLKHILVQEADMIRLDNFNVLRLKKYTSLIDQEKRIEAASYLLNQMRKKGREEYAAETQSMKCGLRFIRQNCTPEIYDQYIKKLETFQKNKVITGLVHGDFHYRNMLKTEKEEYLVIDLDHITNRGIQALDAVHFIIDSQSRHRRVHWTKQLLYYHRKNWDVEDRYRKIFSSYIDIDRRLIAYVYFLDRLGKEFTKEVMSSRYWMGNVLTFITSMAESNTDLGDYYAESS